MHKKRKIAECKKDRGSLGGGFGFEGNRISLGLDLLVSGVSGVSCLDEERIELILRGGVITVVGEGLRLTALENKTVEIIGKITEVGFRYAKIKP